MHRQITPVAKHDRVRVLRFVVVANRAFAVFERQGGCFLRDVFGLFPSRVQPFLLYSDPYEARGGEGRRKWRAYEVEPLLLNFVHNDFEDFVRDRSVTVTFSVDVEGVEPDLVWCGAREALVVCFRGKTRKRWRMGRRKGENTE